MFVMAKRVFLFLIVNILVLTTITLVMNIITTFFGIQLTGQAYYLVFYSLIGMGGAFISLLMSKWMAKKMMGVRVIDPRTQDSTERRLVDMVHQMAKAARLPKMPEVGIYENPEVNAFATGPSKSNSLVAVSSGLLRKMDADEVEGVLGHEVAHIANGDMVTMTLVQGVINTLVLVIARIIAVAVSSSVSERSREMVQFALFMVLQIVLSILGSLVVNYFSRMREFRADAGSAKLTSRDKMIKALQALKNTSQLVDREHESFASLKISGGGVAKLFSTHPPLEERIRRLQGSLH